ncbi:MAG: tryptophan--tRNA ligase [Proteobacteria bacterium]|nr:tryptophan--tRNA ligase [Pseudomonadota bacterium]
MKRVLTGIKPTGTPHIGNMLGAIRPAIELASSGLDAMYFIADYHALTTVHPPKYGAADLKRLTLEVAATWLALGLDPSTTMFYRQSDVPELFELAWVLQCFTPKGWMNKAHAYKAVADAARAAGETDVDAGINMGVYGYPILMAADILAFDIDLVPVGKDQVQHVEIARDIAQRLNHAYGADLLRMPSAKIDEDAQLVPGVDGRKMSKSYDNVIPLFAPSKKLEKVVKQIATDSTPPEAPKDPATSTIFQIYRALARPDEVAAFAERYRAGIGWGDAKKTLFERIEVEIGEARTRYDALIADPGAIDELLVAGAQRARAIAGATLGRVRRAIGIGV